MQAVRGSSSQNRIPGTLVAIGRNGPRISAGAVQTASIPIQPAPDKGKQLNLEVIVQPVPGEQITNNNRSSYALTFQ